MLKALFVMTSISFAKEILEEYKIEYQEWYNDKDEIEIRVDLGDISRVMQDRLRRKFSIKKPMENEYDYLIFWQ